jgi:hypothetical protein
MKDLTRYATAAATPTMEAFADFLEAEVFGGKLPKGIDRDSFRKGVALGGSTRMDFQKSDAWKSDPRNYLANVEASRADRAAERAERAKVSREKAVAREEAAIAKLAEAVAAATARADALRATAEGSEGSEGSEEAA